MSRKIGKTVVCLSLCISLAGCWDSLEFNRSAMVTGMGIDLSEHGLLDIGINIFAGAAQGADQSQSGGGSCSERNTLITTRSDSFTSASRDLIRVVKRRLIYTHTEAWVFGEQLSRTKLVPLISILQREQMLRPRSYLFITSDSPKEILRTCPVYEETSSSDLFAVANEAKYSSTYVPMRMEDFFDRVQGPTQTAYLPMVTIHREQQKSYSKVSGTAVIKKDKMVGDLNSEETMGLLWLIDRFRGGSITIREPQAEGATTVKLIKGKVDIKPVLRDDDLRVNISIRTQAALSDYPADDLMTDRRIYELQNAISRKIKQQVQHTLSKLQQEYRADITDIGLQTYRRYPKQWHKVRNNWDEIFANAAISVSVQTKMTDTGLANKSYN